MMASTQSTSDKKTPRTPAKANAKSSAAPVAPAKKKAPSSATESSAGALARTEVGLVESDKREKTRKVVVAHSSMHPKYGKIMRKRTVLHVHDEANESVLGDMVEVAPCRPISKTKSWRLVRIVRKGAAMKFHGVETPGKE
ncbi:hypothetical protein BH11PLA1_BH11PLA1_22760 [soil metagenome]